MIVTVPFRGKHVAVEIDEEDLPLFERYRWRILEVQTKNGTLRYLRTNIQENGKSRTLLFHREVLGVRDRSIWVDHENDEGLDNRRANLRRCLPGQNIANKRVHVRNKSGYRGVYPTTRGAEILRRHPHRQAPHLHWLVRRPGGGGPRLRRQGARGLGRVRPM